MFCDVSPCVTVLTLVSAKNTSPRGETDALNTLYAMHDLRRNRAPRFPFVRERNQRKLCLVHEIPPNHVRIEHKKLRRGLVCVQGVRGVRCGSYVRGLHGGQQRGQQGLGTAVQ